MSFNQDVSINDEMMYYLQSAKMAHFLNNSDIFIAGEQAYIYEQVTPKTIPTPGSGIVPIPAINFKGKSPPLVDQLLNETALSDYTELAINDKYVVTATTHTYSDEENTYLTSPFVNIYERNAINGELTLVPPSDLRVTVTNHLPKKSGPFDYPLCVGSAIFRECELLYV